MLKLNLPLTNELVISKDRCILKNFFGHGARFTSRAMQTMQLNNRLPLFDTIQTKCYGEVFFVN
jgi:hypothetical protein